MLPNITISLSIRVSDVLMLRDNDGRCHLSYHLARGIVEIVECSAFSLRFASIQLVTRYETLECVDLLGLAWLARRLREIHHTWGQETARNMTKCTSSTG